MARRATLKDVARTAGVSTATVARVLHDNGYVARATRDIVERAIAETGYQINAVAQGLRRQRTYTVGHIMHSVIPNQFFAAVAEGVEEVSSHHGCAVLMVTTHGDVERERKAVETLIQRRVDAIVFTTATDASNVRLAVDAEIPIVQVERMTKVETPSVTADNYGGARIATEHLVELGHRRIGFIGVDPVAMQRRGGTTQHPDVEQERLDGYMDAIRAHDMDVDPELIAFESGYTNVPDARHNRGVEHMYRMLNLQRPPTAIFSTFDLLAAGALQAIYQCGLRVPADVSIVGFDDTYAPYLSPPLTSVRNPTLDMGRVAARLVFDLLEEGSHGGPKPAAERLAMGLVVRESTAPLIRDGHIP